MPKSSSFGENASVLAVVVEWNCGEDAVWVVALAASTVRLPGPVPERAMLHFIAGGEGASAVGRYGEAAWNDCEPGRLRGAKVAQEDRRRGVGRERERRACRRGEPSQIRSGASAQAAGAGSRGQYGVMDEDGSAVVGSSAVADRRSGSRAGWSWRLGAILPATTGGRRHRPRATSE